MFLFDTENIQDDIKLIKQTNHFVVLDLETTGLSPNKGGRIIEIAAVRVVNGEIKDRFHTLVNPQLKIPSKITNLTKISNKDVEDKPTINQVLPEFYKFISNSVVVVHNAAFDWSRFLLDGFEKVGIYPDNKVFCTMKFFKKLQPNKGRGSYTLKKMCDLFKVELDNHHQAMSDTESTAKCLIKILEMFSPESLIGPEPQFESPEIKHTPVQVKQVRYWEKRKNKREMFRRQYVRLTTGKEWGSVYFDIPTQSWGNKDFPLPLNFEKVEEAVLQFLNIKSRNELINFRN